MDDALNASRGLGKIAQSLAAAADAFTDYVNVIAPGAGRAALQTPMPIGEQLLDEGEEAEKGFAGATRRTARNADELAEKARQVADFVQKISGHGPAGAVTPSTGTPPPGTPAISSAPTAGDHASGIVVLGTLAAAGAKKLRDWFAKHREDNTDWEH